MHYWQHVPFFLAVSQAGSFRGAGIELKATHATVRNHIAALEHSLDTQLVRRSKKGLELTEAGQVFLVKAQQAEKRLTEGRNGVLGIDRQAAGLIRVSVEPITGHFLLAPIFADFGKHYPNIELEIRLTYEIEDITRLETDISIRNAETVSDDVVARKLFRTASCVYATQDYIDANLLEAGPGGQNLTWIGYGGEPEQAVWIEQSAFPNARIRHAVRDVEMHLHLVRGGLGMTYLPTWCEPLFPELRRVPGAAVVHKRNLWILLHSDLRKVARVRLFVDFVAQVLREYRTV